MFARHTTPGARVAGPGARVAQNVMMDQGAPAYAPPACAPGVGCVATRGFLGPDAAATVDQTLLPATIPGTSTAVSYTISGTGNAGAGGNFGIIGLVAVGAVTIAAPTYFILSFTPRCAVKALALYVNSLTVTVGVEFTGLFIGKSGANNQQNLLMMTGPVGTGSVSADAFADLNACVPLLDIGQCATPQLPFILVGRIMPLQNAAITSTAHLVRAALVVERCG